MKAISPLQHYSPNMLLIRENEISRKMYIIKSGKVRVFKSYMGQKITLAILGRGEVFGEFSFFDAKPRSATVEALTDVVAYVVDGDVASQQVKDLPEWVLPILKSVFQRFREADQKLTVLQTMNQFEKKHFKNDSVAQKVYQELLRFNKALKLLYQRDLQADGYVRKDTLLKELDDVLGARYINLESFWQVLCDHDFIVQQNDSDKVTLNTISLENWILHLLSEVESGRYTFLSHSALALLRRVVGATEVPEPAQTGQRQVTVTFQDIDLENMPLWEDGLKEIQEKGILKAKDRQFSFEPSLILQTYFYQNLLKTFDHTIAQLD